jgi:hypothetical protein
LWRSLEKGKKMQMGCTPIPFDPDSPIIHNNYSYIKPIPRVLWEDKKMLKTGVFCQKNLKLRDFLGRN